MGNVSGGQRLLQIGNAKLGLAIHQWSVPAVSTCPGSTEVCRRACYATKGRYVFRRVKAKLQWCLEQCKCEDFVPRMADEIRRSGVLVLRIHCSGDFWCPEYAEKWLAIMKQFPRVRFYTYARSWRVPVPTTPPGSVARAFSQFVFSIRSVGCSSGIRMGRSGQGLPPASHTACRTFWTPLCGAAS